MPSNADGRPIHEVVNPADETVLALLPESSADEIDTAVQRAAAAQSLWWAMSPEDRSAIMFAIADGIERKADDLALLECRNVGMPIADARGTVRTAAAVFRFYAASPLRDTGETIPVAGGIDMTFREPIGVVGLITPWNFPIAIASFKLAPALAAGNGVVLKPSELTPLTTLELPRIVRDAGLPDGLLEVATGAGPSVGERIVRHPGVGKIGFTGSTAVGRTIAAITADRIARVGLELGGKSPSIVFADADVAGAVDGLVSGAFGNAGQDCCARSRVFVQEPVVDEFLVRLQDLVKRLRVGDPMAEDTQVGPLISAKQRDRVTRYVDSASVAVQGSMPEGPGFWFPPTVLYPVPDDHAVFREEIFGPVISVHSFRDEAEVVRRANDTTYGLAATIWTADGARAIRVARALLAGAVAINSYTSVRLQTPFGGFKQSGTGRELGAGAVAAYSETKNVFMATT